MKTSPASRPRTMTWRRRLMATLTVSTMTCVVALYAAALAPGDYGVIDVLIMALACVMLPFSAVGFWNALIGLCIQRFSRDPLGSTCPPASNVATGQPITTRTAILSCVRNEEVGSVFARLSVMLEDLEREGATEHFDLFVLSDTDSAAIATDELRAFAALEAQHRAFRTTYRRREHNQGFKAGNIRDFCERWGKDYDHVLVLDADSLMSASAMARLVRVMQANPDLGILQGLVVGAPTRSPFARVFQYGMRFGMRSYSLGSAWWQGDCGPYWGHNAIIRVAPFIRHCALPEVRRFGPLSGDILSHDQLEAVLMRRGGYAVRLIAIEDESFEENPPNLAEFIRRDLRWCAGNLQYIPLLGMPGISWTSRFQLVNAVMMFLAPVAWMLMISLFAVNGLTNGTLHEVDQLYGVPLLWISLALVFSPKLATIVDVLVDADAVRRFGGRLRIALSVLAEIVFSALLAPIAALSITVFVLGLLTGRRVGWTGQHRQAQQISLRAATRLFWPQALFGVALVWATAQGTLNALLLCAPTAAGLVMAIPFAVATSSPALASWLRPLFQVPEERETPAILSRLERVEPERPDRAPSTDARTPREGSVLRRHAQRRPETAA